MQVEFVVGLGPITRDPGAADAFWGRALGIPFRQAAPGYRTNDSLEGVRAFAMWSLEQAARSTFGTSRWPVDRAVPQAWIELDLGSPQAVADAVAELRGAGHDVLVDAHDEPWGQTAARVQSPEGLLVAITYTPSLHREG